MIAVDLVMMATGVLIDQYNPLTTLDLTDPCSHQAVMRILEGIEAVKIIAYACAVIPTILVHASFACIAEMFPVFL